MSQLSTGLSDAERKGDKPNKPKRRSPPISPASTDPDALLSTHHVRALMGGVTSVTLTRWLNTGTLPPPDAIIGNRYFWKRRTIIDLQARMKSGVPEALAAAKEKQAHTKAGIVKAET